MGDDYFTPIISKVVSFSLVPVLWYYFLIFAFSVSEQAELFPYEEAVDNGISFVVFFTFFSICNAIIYLIYYLFDK